VGDKLSVALSLILENIPLINVLLVDDHELVRAGIRRILEDIKGLKLLARPAAARMP
jgi:two-component system invasion response regulator UvrY